MRELVKNSDVASFPNTINVIYIKLYKMVLHIKLHLFVPLPMTLIIFQGHGSVKQFQVKILCYESIKLKLCMVIYHVVYIMKTPHSLILALLQGEIINIFPDLAKKIALVFF